MSQRINGLPEGLQNLLVKDLLEADAVRLINEIIRLTKADHKICLFYPGAYIYAFLVNQRSPVCDFVEKNFSPFKGDLLLDSYKAATRADRNGFHWDHPEGWDIQVDCMRGLANALGVSKLNSCQLAASLLFPFNPFYKARKKRKINWEQYNYTKFVQPEIAGGCYDWGEISLKSLASLGRDLVVYDGTNMLDPQSVSRRFNLLLSPVGNYVKVSIVERWGKHIIDPNEDGLFLSSGLWLPHKTIFSVNEINEFERLLNLNPACQEETFQEFFKHIRIGSFC